MVQKSNDDTQQRRLDGGPPLQRYSSAISDLIELNADGTRRNSQHALKISPASAFKKASVTKKHSSGGHRSKKGDDELDSKRSTTGRRHAGLHAPPLVFVDDEDEQERGGDHPQHQHDQEVVRALFKSHKGQQPPPQEEADVVPSATTTTTTTTTVATTTAKEVVEKSRSAVYSLEDADKRTRLLAYLLQDSEWKQLFPTCAALSLGADDDDDDDDSRVADADFDVDTFMNMTTNATTLETPLHTACWKGPPQLALLMLETIPAPEQRRLALLKRDVHGNTPLHIACAHLDHSVDFTVIKNLLLLAPEALDQVNTSGGDSPLHLLVGTSPGFARRRSSSATTTTTLQDSSSSSSSSSTNTKKKLDFSVEAAAEEAISSLLQMVGHWATMPNDTGLTLLHCAIAHGAHERVLVKLLSMSMSASVGSPTIMGTGGGAAAIPDNRGMLPLHFVAAFGGKHGGTPWTFVSQLIEAYEHGIVAQTENGDTALHLLLSNAAKRTAMEGSFLNRNTTKLAELLVMNNNAPTLVHHHHHRRSRTSSSIISPLLVKNKVDLTPLHCCALFDTPAQLTRIVMDCSPVSEQASAVTTTFGATPVHLACASSHPDAANIEALATRLACCTRDDKDRTPLVVALQNDKMPSQVIKLLIAVYPQAVDHAVRKGQYLPLHLALMNSSVKESVIRNLLKASPNTIKAVTKSGNTALHIACQQSHPNATIIKLLLDRYREANRTRNKLGQLPIDLVQSKKHYKSLLKKVPGLVPPVVVSSSSSGGDDNNLPLVKSSPSKTLSPSKLPKTSSTSGSSSSNKISSSSSSSKKKAAILAAAAAAAAASTTTTTAAAAAAAANTSKSSNSSTVRSSSHDGYGDDDCDYEDDNISEKVSCLTDPSHF